MKSWTIMQIILLALMYLILFRMLLEILAAWLESRKHKIHSRLTLHRVRMWLIKLLLHGDGCIMNCRLNGEGIKEGYYLVDYGYSEKAIISMSKPDKK